MAGKQAGKGYGELQNAEETFQKDVITLFRRTFCNDVTSEKNDITLSKMGLTHLPADCTRPARPPTSRHTLPRIPQHGLKRGRSPRPTREYWHAHNEHEHYTDLSGFRWGSGNTDSMGLTLPNVHQ
uniref:Uncharacterized protein n=1 Tax=Timema tahoe TaxID=61484 RepID=A0A7R9IRP0_9NEOP|nr:unnamed protein product [Timema tahoe]